MKIRKIDITNIKSFRDKATIDFSDECNILIGPNAGGKSNLLDILTITIRHFIHLYIEQTKGSGKTIGTHDPFSPLNKHLEKFIGNEASDSRLEITFTVGENDIQNIESLKTHKTSLETILLNNYTNPPITNLDTIENIDLEILKQDQELTYIVSNGNVDRPPPESSEGYFISYLYYLELFNILARNLETIKINPTHLYFSPYREVQDGNPRTVLSELDYSSLIKTYAGSDSRKRTSLFEISKYYFARKYRALMDEGGDYRKKYEEDKEVKFVSEYLEGLGYAWEIKQTNREKNAYEISLLKEGKSFLLNQASSGEKEILNFLLGIFALNLNGGLVLIDEPELHLHPRWQNVLMDLFIKLPKETGNQFILSTHSPVFVNEKTIANVSRIYMYDKSSRATKVKSKSFEKQKDILHMINSHNNEKMFFADKVLLVEGISDRLIFQKLIDVFSENGKNETIEVLEVHGKTELNKYRDFIKSINVSSYIVADYDYIFTIGDPSIKKLFEADSKAIDKKVLKSKKSLDRRALILRIEEAIDINDVEHIREVLEHIKLRHPKLKDDITLGERAILDAFFLKKKEDNIYILSKGELEDYLPKGTRNLEDVINLINKDHADFMYELVLHNPDDTKELIDIVLDILDVDSEERIPLYSKYKVPFK
jgi:predicted ATP-dependent endonuclease of OLD family